MAVAGVGGYMTVKYHAWQQVEPLVARAKELGRSLQTLAPSASPEPTPAPVAAPAPAPAPTIQPTVVPIEPERAVAPPPVRAVERVKRRPPPRHPRRQLQPLSAEAAAEEALLSKPSRGR
jgi:translation initiation factor IF-2